jgi:hypothetical protein
VDLDVVGSNPITRPSLFLRKILRKRRYGRTAQVLRPSPRRFPRVREKPDRIETRLDDMVLRLSALSGNDLDQEPDAIHVSSDRSQSRAGLDDRRTS